MLIPSLIEAFNVEREPWSEDELSVGDVVRVGLNAGPYHTVLALHGQTAWVENRATHDTALAPRHRCRRVAQGGDGEGI